MWYLNGKKELLGRLPSKALSRSSSFVIFILPDSSWNHFENPTKQKQNTAKHFIYTFQARFVSSSSEVASGGVKILNSHTFCACAARHLPQRLSRLQAAAHFAFIFSSHSDVVPGRANTHTNSARSHLSPFYFLTEFLSFCSDFDLIRRGRRRTSTTPSRAPLGPTSTVTVVVTPPPHHHPHHHTGEDSVSRTTSKLFLETQRSLRAPLPRSSSSEAKRRWWAAPAVCLFCSRRRRRCSSTSARLAVLCSTTAEHVGFRRISSDSSRIINDTDSNAS